MAGSFDTVPTKVGDRYVVGVSVPPPEENKQVIYFLSKLKTWDKLSDLIATVDGPKETPDLYKGKFHRLWRVQ